MAQSIVVVNNDRPGSDPDRAIDQVFAFDNLGASDEQLDLRLTPVRLMVSPGASWMPSHRYEPLLDMIVDEGRHPPLTRGPFQMQISSLFIQPTKE